MTRRATASKRYVLEAPRPQSVAQAAGQEGVFKYEVMRRMGYFSVMQLFRVHSLLGDCQMTLETVQNVDFGTKLPMFYEIPACHVSLFYYMDFAYMIMPRYVDAIRVFGQILWGDFKGVSKRSP